MGKLQKIARQGQEIITAADRQTAVHRAMQDAGITPQSVAEKLREQFEATHHIVVPGGKGEAATVFQEPDNRARGEALKIAGLFWGISTARVQHDVNVKAEDGIGERLKEALRRRALLVAELKERESVTVEAVETVETSKE
jgi:hypothetical protein